MMRINVLYLWIQRFVFVFVIVLWWVGSRLQWFSMTKKHVMKRKKAEKRKKKKLMVEKTRQWRKEKRKEENTRELIWSAPEVAPRSAILSSHQQQEPSLRMSRAKEKIENEQGAAGSRVPAPSQSRPRCACQWQPLSCASSWLAARAGTVRAFALVANVTATASLVVLDSPPAWMLLLSKRFSFQL